jgi:VanZ family protein
MTFKDKVYKYTFWVGYFAVLIASFLSIKGGLSKIYIGPVSIHMRLDHLLHLFVYFLICLYFLFGQYKALILFKTNSLLKFTFLITILGTITELVQLWVPERTFNVFDLVSNMAGVIIGLAVIKMMQRRKGTKA